MVELFIDLVQKDLFCLLCGEAGDLLKSLGLARSQFIRLADLLLELLAALLEPRRLSLVLLLFLVKSLLSLSETSFLSLDFASSVAKLPVGLRSQFVDLVFCLEYDFFSTLFSRSYRIINKTGRLCFRRADLSFSYFTSMLNSKEKANGAADDARYDC